MEHAPEQSQTSIPAPVMAARPRSSAAVASASPAPVSKLTARSMNSPACLVCSPPVLMTTTTAKPSKACSAPSSMFPRCWPLRLRPTSPQLEHEIDAITDAIPPFRCFIVPGGSRGAALAHVCRTVCRRAERRIIALAEEAPVDAVLLSYVNRLSDFLFVLARKVNFSQDIEEKRVF